MLQRAKGYITQSDNQEYSFENSFNLSQEFQDVCRFCYSFNGICKCIADIDYNTVNNTLEHEYNVTHNENMEKVEPESVKANVSSENTPHSFSSQILYYSAPLSVDTARCSIDSEEYHLKSRFRYSIPPHESRTVMTNICIIRRHGELARKLEIQNKIQSGWLSDMYTGMLALKTGVLSPEISGDLCIKIYNKTRSEVIVESCSPLGVMRNSCYEYR